MILEISDNSMLSGHNSKYNQNKRLHLDSERLSTAEIGCLQADIKGSSRVCLVSVIAYIVWLRAECSLSHY